jgi:hypothetical protein
MPIEIIVRIIEATIARFGDDASYDQYKEIAAELFPKEMKTLRNSFARQGFIKWLKNGMRHAFNVDELDADAPQVQLDLLPGLPAPAYLNIGTWQTPRPRRFSDCTVLDLDTAIQSRGAVLGRISARVEDLQAKARVVACACP